MHKIISNDIFIKNNKNIILNPTSLNKRRFHGSLTEGIYSNIKFALSNIRLIILLFCQAEHFFITQLIQT